MQVHVHGQNLTTVYDQIDMSMLPEEYLPDDYTGPNAGTVQEIASKSFTLYRGSYMSDHLIWNLRNELFNFGILRALPNKIQKLSNEFHKFHSK